MDGRARIAFSGLAAFAVTATVVATVVTTTAAAIADTPGAAIGAAVVDVKASAKPTATPAPEIITDLGDAVTPPAATPPAPVQIEVEAETLSAPAPVVVPTVPTAASPEPAPAPDTAASLRDALASDDPEAVYSWAAAHGWSRERVDRFLSTRPGAGDRRDDADPREHATRDDDRRGAEQRPRFAPPSPPVQTGSPAVTETPQRGDGTKRDRSPGSPDHRD